MQNYKNLFIPIESSCNRYNRFILLLQFENNAIQFLILYRTSYIFICRHGLSVSILLMYHLEIVAYCICHPALSVIKAPTRVNLCDIIRIQPAEISTIATTVSPYTTHIRQSFSELGWKILFCIVFLPPSKFISMYLHPN